MAMIAPFQPGELLLEEFLEPLGVTQHRLAVSIGVPPRRINEIAHGKRRITADTALRLARYFGTTDRFWLRPVSTSRWRRITWATSSRQSAHFNQPERHPVVRPVGPGRSEAGTYAVRTRSEAWAYGACRWPGGSSGMQLACSSTSRREA